MKTTSAVAVSIQAVFPLSGLFEGVGALFDSGWSLATDSIVTPFTSVESSWAARGKVRSMMHGSMVIVRSHTLNSVRCLNTFISFAPLVFLFSCILASNHNITVNPRTDL